MPTISAVRSTQRRVTSSTPVLRRGSRGPVVTQLQQKLRAKGHNVSVDGDFGPKTEAAVKAFQQSRGLRADGVVGPKTWGKLNEVNRPPPAPPRAQPTLRQGASGAAVSTLQHRLRAHGHNVSVDGSFGPRTADAVRAFQRAKGLSVDGVVGPNTWSKLNGAPSANRPPPAQSGTPTTGYVNGRPVSFRISSVGNGKFLRTDAANAFNRMKADAARRGINLTVVSGYRTMAQQRYLYNLYISGRGNLAARPGYSNHQGGISADVSTPGGYGSAQYRWMAANARRYGFVNDVRGEPWHWTYRPS